MYETVACVPIVATILLFTSFFAYHVYYLTFIHFDYGYNMTANIAIGKWNPNPQKCFVRFWS